MNSSLTPVFIHIPKTGGTYITQKDSEGYFKVCKPLKTIGHNYIVCSKYEYNPIYCREPWRHRLTTLEVNILKEPVVFSVVRNHWDWLVSYFFHAGGKKSKFLDKMHYDYQLSQKGFDYFLKSIVDRDSIWPDNKFIFTQVFSSSGNLIPDYILRTHTLDEDLKQFASETGFTYSTKSRKRVSRKDDYKSYYTDSLAQLVLDTWKDEIELYGFSYENIESDEKTLLKRKINEKVKKTVKYFRIENQLYVNGACYA